MNPIDPLLRDMVNHYLDLLSKQQVRPEDQGMAAVVIREYIRQLEAA